MFALHQNRRQKVFNRGDLRFCGGLWVCARGLGTLKIDKISTYSVSCFTLGGLKALFGWAKPPQKNPGDGTALHATETAPPQNHLPVNLFHTMPLASNLLFTALAIQALHLSMYVFEHRISRTIQT